MIHEKVRLSDKQAEGYVVPLGRVSLVFVVTDVGLVGCGAFDVAALDHFDYPAARVKATGRGSVAAIEDLLGGEVKEANSTAQRLGVEVGMSGQEALERM